MKINLHEIPIRDIYAGYQNSQEEGVLGYGGKLNIRPKYQREFIYKEPQQIAVINTIKKNLPLNVFYWVKNNENEFEMLDGQQRTLSICSYLNNEYSVGFQFFHGLTEDEKNQILDYKLMVYFCEGTDKEKLDWFKTINIAGVKLTNQELRNAVYTGPWLTDAKLHFSKTNCVAYLLAKDYLSGSPIRQDYLETVLKWVSDKDNLTIEEYMGKFQGENDASQLWSYFKKVIYWVQDLFPDYRKEMKGIDWGIYYNNYKNKEFNPNELKNRYQELIMNDDVRNIKGIYEYLIDGQEKHLNLRIFDEKDKLKKYEEQQGICIKCQEHFEINEMEADHIKPWSEGGKTNLDNCQILCRNCNRRKSNK